MRLALTVWEERISPLFDAARTALIVEVREDGVSSEELPLTAASGFSRAAQLQRLGVDTVICGAISAPAATLLEAFGIRLVAFVTGRVETVLAAHLAGTLTRSAFRMPGCGRRRSRRRPEFDPNGRGRRHRRGPGPQVH